MAMMKGRASTTGMSDSTRMGLPLLMYFFQANELICQATTARSANDSDHSRML
jgi:hypothetical protein